MNIWKITSLTLISLMVLGGIVSAIRMSFDISDDTRDYLNTQAVSNNMPIEEYGGQLIDEKVRDELSNAHRDEFIRLFKQVADRPELYDEAISCLQQAID